MSTQLVFSVSIKDCRVDTFRSGGKGGQNQNKVESGVRIVHEPSGAVGEARDSRDQLHNKRAAFARMAATDKFKTWVRLEYARHVTGETPEQRVAKMMAPDNIKIEVVDEDGKWCAEERARIVTELT